MLVTHWRTASGTKVLISTMTEQHKVNVAAMVSKKYDFRVRAENETLQEYLGQLLLWLELKSWCKINSENYCQ
jgi:hypothetical protein